MNNKLLYAIIIALLGIIIYQNYLQLRTIQFNYNNKNYQLTEENLRKAFRLNKTNTIDTTIIAYTDQEYDVSKVDNLLNNCAFARPLIVASPSRNIEILEAQDLISRYQVTLDSSIPRSVYFSLEHIIKKIDSLKDSTFFKNLNAKYENFGLRAYFGKYGPNCEPYNCNDRDLGIDCANKNTVFLELTYDFNLNDNDRSNASTYNPRGDGRNISDISKNNTLHIKNTLRNVGGLCPPNCPDNDMKHDQELYPH
ncbi:MAG: hypothetical protein ABIO44_12625 [Saprospiraceae bacterium]